jgi:hypothetical protein
MADSPVFEWACDTLERRSGLTRIQARGTMRIVVGQAGLDSKSLRVSQLHVVATRLLPKELRARGLEDVDMICEDLAQCPMSVEHREEAGVPSDPEEVFKRLGRHN